MSQCRLDEQPTLLCWGTGASTWGWRMTGHQGLPGQLYGFCTRRCNRERCQIRSGPGWLERLLLSGTRAPWDSPDAACPAELERLLSSARVPRNSPDVICQAVLGLLGSALGAGTQLVLQCFPGRLYGFCARRCNRERCRIRSGPGWLERLLLSGTGELRDGPSGAWVMVLGLLLSGTRERWDSPDAVWLAVLGPASSELSLEAVRGGRKVSSMATQPWGRRGHRGARSPPGAKPTLSPCYQA